MVPPKDTGQNPSLPHHEMFHEALNGIYLNGLGYFTSRDISKEIDGIGGGTVLHAEMMEELNVGYPIVFANRYEAGEAVGRISNLEIVRKLGEKQYKSIFLTIDEAGRIVTSRSLARKSILTYPLFDKPGFNHFYIDPDNLNHGQFDHYIYKEWFSLKGSPREEDLYPNAPMLSSSYESTRSQLYYIGGSAKFETNEIRRADRIDFTGFGYAEELGDGYPVELTIEIESERRFKLIPADAGEIILVPIASIEVRNHHIASEMVEQQREQHPEKMLVIAINNEELRYSTEEDRWQGTLVTMALVDREMFESDADLTETELDSILNFNIIELTVTRNI